MKDQAQKFGRSLRGKSDVEILEKKNIVLNCKPVTPAEAIYACGRLLLESGCIEEDYIPSMLDRNKIDSVAIGSHVAIPHGGDADRKFVRKTGLAVMTYPDGIDWDGETVRLVIAIASKGEEHLEILKRIAAIAPDETSTDQLVDAADFTALYANLNGLDVTKVKRPLLEKRNIILNCHSITPEEAIRSCGQLMLESGYIHEGYIQGMLERNTISPVSIGNHVAIPHGTLESQKFIRRTGLVVMTYPDGIQWDDQIVRLVIGIASKGEEHLSILDRIVEVAETVKSIDTLVDHTTAEALYNKLNGLS